MKTIFLMSSFLLLTLAISQKPEKVFSIVKEMKSTDWYETQSDLWEKETKANPKNAEAWYYYFSANRALKNICWKDQEKTEQYFKVCDQIVKDAYKAVPNSFEANHMIWWHSFSDPTKFSYLEKAYQINPLDERTYRDMMTHYALELNDAKVNEFANKIFKVNEMPAAAYNWAYNLLAEAKPNAIILTAGDNDTYLPWIMQQVFGFRKDVTVLNTSLLFIKDYQNKLFKSIGIPEFKWKNDSVKSQEEYASLKKAMFEHIFKQDEKHPVYVSSTAIHQFRNEFEPSLYVVGLSYKYCENDIDNVALIKRNYEKRYLLDYLDQNFSFHSLDKKSDDFNVHYLQAFIKLHTHYTDSEEIVKAEILKKRIKEIARKGGQEEHIKAWIDEVNK